MASPSRVESPRCTWISVSELVQQFRREEIHTLVETCGLFTFDSFAEKILPHVDLIYMDIKIVDPGEHKRWCCVSNERIMENFLKLHRMWQEGGV